MYSDYAYDEDHDCQFPGCDVTVYGVGDSQEEALQDLRERWADHCQREHPGEEVPQI